MKILLVGHACSPRQGSEPSFTWNWAWHLSNHHEVWVLAHPHDREGVEAWLANHPNPRLHFEWVDLPPQLDPWEPVAGKRLIRLHYLLWQRAALRVARELASRHRFDLVHHVSWGTVSAPPLLWKLGVPLVWGPVGGGQAAPPGFERYFGPSSITERIRPLRIKLCTHTPGFRNAIAKSSMVLTTNPETTRILKARGAGKKLKFFLDSGLTSEFLPGGPIIRKGNGTLNLLWAGKLEPLKALAIALEALAKVKGLPVRLRVAGDGKMRQESEAYTKELGLDDRVQFLGNVPWSGMPMLYRQADAFVFTSLRDSFGAQVLEAMAHSLPILALDHQGVGSYVPGDAGIKVPVTTPEETVARLAQGIRLLHQYPETRQRMGERAWACASHEAWERRAERMCRLYEGVVEQHYTGGGKQPEIAA